MGEPRLVQGDVEGENIVHVASKGDTVLAVSGQFSGKYSCWARKVETK